MKKRLLKPMWKQTFLTMAFMLIGVCSTTAQESFSSNVVAEEGAWCWFADPRALHYENTAGTINATYIGYIDVHGNVKATQYDWLTHRKTDILLRSYFQPDDHDNPTFIVLPDERVMIFYTRHTDEAKIWYRISKNPGDISSLGEEKYLATSANTTYPSPFILSDDPNHIYLCWRGINWHPTIARLTMPDSNDNCSFDFGPKQIVQSTGARPYAKYQSNGKDKIYLSYTTGHPDNEQPNWLYFNVIDINNGNGPILRDINGTQLSVINSGVFNVNKTDSYASSYPLTVVDKTDNIRNWVWQITLDSDEHPVIAYTHINNEKTTHVYWYSRWTGSEWRNTWVQFGGHAFHQNWNSTELCYSGGMAVDPDNINDLYLSIPTTSGAYNKDGVYEIWKYTINDDGTVGTSIQLTSGSSKNNVRPFIIPGSSSSPMRLAWMNGDYYYWIVKNSYPLGFPTKVMADYTWEENYTSKQSGDDNTLETPGTITVGIAMDTSNYSGTILTIGEGSGKLTYSLDSNTYPVVTIGGNTYQSQNKLYTSDDWATKSSGTSGDNWPTKLSTWVLSMTYDGTTLTTYRNGIVDQVIETSAFTGGEVNSDGNHTILFVNSQSVCHSPITVQTLQEEAAADIEEQAGPLALETIKMPTEARTDIVLSSTAIGKDITWTSSDEAVMASDGTLACLNKDIPVKMTASTGTSTKDFLINGLKRDLPKNLRYAQSGTLNMTGNTATGFSTNTYGTAPAGLLDSLRSFTFLVTIKANSLTGQPRIYDFGSGSGNSIFLRANPLAAGIKLNGGTTTMVNGATTLTTGKEYKLAVSFSAATHTTKIYIDGVEDASGTANVNEAYMIYQVAGDARNYIGRTQWWDGAYANDNQDFVGTIKELKLYDVCLTRKEICELQNCEYTVDVLPSSLQNFDFEGSYSVQSGSGVSSDRAIYEPESWTVSRSNPNENDITALKTGDLYFSNFFASLDKPASHGSKTYWIRQNWGTPTLTLSQVICLPAGFYTLQADVWQSGLGGAASVIASTEGGGTVTSPSLENKTEWQTAELNIESDGVAKTTITLQALHNSNGSVKIIGFDNVIITRNTDNITFYDSKSNEVGVGIYNGNKVNVTISGRTLYKDGDWNSLSLPFSLDASQIAASPLAGAEIMGLESASLKNENTLLTLYFEPVTSITAGTPYIVRWTSPGADITNPSFTNVTISADLNDVVVADGKVVFHGSYSPIYCKADDHGLFFLGTGSNFYYPSVTGILNSFRSYYTIDEEISSTAKSIKMEFTDPTSVNTLENDSHRGDWYSISGIKLYDKPTHQGIYINNGKKVIIR